MPYSSVQITPGSGAPIAIDAVAGLDYQVVKLDFGPSGSSIVPVADATYGLGVDIKRFPATAVVVNNPTAANLKVDASGATVPISAAAAIPVSALVGAPAFVRLSDGTNPIATLPVSGTVTANQGSVPAANANAWPIKLSDGTDTVGITTVGGAKALKVDVVQSVNLTGGSFVDLVAFTDGASTLMAVGGQFIGTPSNPADGQIGVARITQLRAWHVNLRKNDGTELGIQTAPVRTDPTGTTNQPVTQAVANWTTNTVLLGGAAIALVGTGIQVVAIKDSLGAALSAANPLVIAHKGQSETRVTKSVAITASQTGTIVWTPTVGKTFYLRKLVLVLSTGGAFTLFDGSNAAVNIVVDGTWPVGAWDIAFNEPWPSAAVNNVLKYTTGAAVGTLTAHGFEV